MERRYLSKELINSLDFEKNCSYGGNYEANFFEKRFDINGREYLRVSLLYANEDLVKIYFDDFDNYHINQWNKRETLSGRKCQDVNAICKEVAESEAFNVVLYCYEDGEVNICFCHRNPYCLDDETYLLVGDNVSLLMDKVVEFAKKRFNFDFNITKGYTLFDGNKYYKSLDDFDNIYIKELKSLGVSFDDFAEYLITKKGFNVDGFRKFINVEDNLSEWSCFSDSIEYFKARDIIRVFSKFGTKEEKLKVIDEIRNQIENDEI